MKIEINRSSKLEDTAPLLRDLEIGTVFTWDWNIQDLDQRFIYMVIEGRGKKTAFVTLDTGEHQGDTDTSAVAVLDVSLVINA